MKKEKSFIAVITCLSLSVTVNAQDTLKNKDLREVVVSASRTEKELIEAGRSISIVTAEEIKNSGATSVAELLAMQEGIYVVGAGQNPGTTSSIFTRGANSNQTVILIDGIRITDPSAVNNSIDVSELSLANISRVEIVRGSHSTIYGSSAIGGVVNFITKKAEKEGLSADVSIIAGTFGEGTSEFSENAYLAYALKNGIYVSAEVYNTNVKGLNSTVDTVSNPSVYKHSDRGDDFDKLDWVVKAGYKNKKTDGYVSFKKTNQFTEIDKGAYKDDDNYTLDFKRDLLTYGLSHKLNDKLSFAYTGGFSGMSRTAIDDSSHIDTAGNFDKQYSGNFYKGKIMSNEVQGNYITKGISLVLGGGLYNEEMELNTRFYYYNAWAFPAAYNEIRSSLDSVNPKSSTVNVFMHTDLNGVLLSPKAGWANLSLGARMSSHNVFGTNFTYEINPSFRLAENSLLFLTYATGFNAPSLYQLYDPTVYRDSYTGAPYGITRGNKKLDPETSRTFEIGFRQKWTNLEASVAYYNTVVENMIEYVVLWNKDIGIDTLAQDWSRDDYRGETYINAGTMTTRGLELGLTYSLNEKLIVSGNLSLLSGKLNYDPDKTDTANTGGHHIQFFSNGSFAASETEIRGLSRRPATANLSITYLPVKILRLRMDVRHAGARGDVFYDTTIKPYGALGTVSVNKYTLIDLSANVTIIKGLSAGLKLTNVLDTKYSEINGFTTRGAGIYGNIRYSF